VPSTAIIVELSPVPAIVKPSGKDCSGIDNGVGVWGGVSVASSNVGVAGGGSVAGMDASVGPDVSVGVSSAGLTLSTVSGVAMSSANVDAGGQLTSEPNKNASSKE
jgi:hypothetical protein